MESCKKEDKNCETKSRLCLKKKGLDCLKAVAKSCNKYKSVSGASSFMVSLGIMSLTSLLY